MSKHVFALETDAYAVIDTSRGTVSFGTPVLLNNEEELTDNQKKAILEFYLKQFKKNKKVSVHINEFVNSGCYNELFIQLREGLISKIDLKDIRFFDVHLGEKADLGLFSYIWENRIVGENCNDGCVYCNPLQKNVVDIIEVMRKIRFYNIAFVMDIEDCIHEQSFIQLMDAINEATIHGLVTIIILNVSYNSIDKIRKVYNKLFKEGAFRTRINEIWINSVNGNFDYKKTPLDLMLINNIECYEKILELLSEYPELMTMRPVGNNYVKRIQSVFEKRVPLRPIQAYEMKELVRIEIKNGLCICNLYSDDIKKCQNCENFELCGGLIDSNNRCIDFKNVLTSVHNMYRFIKGGK